MVTAKEPLGLLESAPVGEADRSLLTRLDAFQAPFLEQKLLADAVFVSRSEFERAFLEFKRFVTVRIVFKAAFPMASLAVDLLWHQFILFTKRYFAFCDEFVGEYLHHEPIQPCKGGSHNHSLFRVRYRELFGELDELWNTRDSDCSLCGTTEGTCR